jgi:lipid II:glycine glycyltransferase (peptidoglycan interpeptide bridge formation enzyme)
MSEKHPLQTKAWADFRAEWGNEILKTKYGYLTLHKLPFINKKIGMFIRGPEPSKKMLSDLKEIAKKHNLIFIKLEPFVRKTDKLTALMKESGAVEGKTLFTPTSFWIDLSKSEEELMKSFHQKTRYNIRYAERKGVTVEEDNSDKAFGRYIELMRETVERQGFYAHSEKYHRLMWQTLKKAGIAHLLVAKHNPTSQKASLGASGKIMTTWVLFKSEDFLYYPYGASTFDNKNLQANSAMMWAAIKFGKKHKLKYFDLWGREEGKGFTKFKEGFNPEVVEFLGTWDLVTSNWYWPYRTAEFFRWRILRMKTIFKKPSF